jgi:hypothetical protein
MDRPSDERATISWLVEIVPELRPLLEEHVACYDEVLPYVVFESDFTRWVIERVRAGDHEPARRFVDAVEVLMTTSVEPSADDPVWNLAGVAFVESLALDGDWADAVPTIRSWMGPRTVRDFEAYPHR